MAEEKENAGERTEEPTQQRREDFRRRGQVAQTKELASAFALFGGALSIWFFARFLLEQVTAIFASAYGDKLVETVSTESFSAVSYLVFSKGALMFLPIAVLALFFGIFSSVLQVGFLVNEEALQPKLDKLNPVNGLQRLFSLRSLIEGLKSVIKVALIIGIMILVMRNELFHLPVLIQLGVEQIFAYVGDVSIRLLTGVGFFMLVMAGADYGYQRWQLEKQMRMTKQEVKEEVKSREGDPLIRARIRKIQRDIATKRMLKAIPNSDVVITNPTHLAIVLKYDSTKMAAPQVVAKGADFMAEKIRNIAREHNIPIVENKPLAQTLYKTMKIGAIIPRELFKAVAEVLAYVYRLKNKVIK